MNDDNKYQYIKKMGKQLKFNQKLHDKYDIPARKCVLDKLGDILIENPDKFGPDLIINSDVCKYKYLEIQVCTAWIDDFPYENMYIHERKNRYKEDTLFLTLSKNLNKGYIFDTQGIADIKPHRIKKYSREFIYDIPWHKCIHVHMDTVDSLTLELY